MKTRDIRSARKCICNGATQERKENCLRKREIQAAQMFVMLKQKQICATHSQKKNNEKTKQKIAFFKKTRKKKKYLSNRMRMYEMFEHRTTKKKDFVFCYWITASKCIQNDTIDKRIEQWNALNLFQTIESTLIHSCRIRCSMASVLPRNWMVDFYEIKLIRLN